MPRRQAKLGYQWLLRSKMAEHGMFATTDLAPLLAERGVQLSPAQVYRLVTGTPERLSLRTLVALCDILQCGPSDLIEPVVASARPGTAARLARGPAEPGGRRPRRAEINGAP